MPWIVSSKMEERRSRSRRRGAWASCSALLFRPIISVVACLALPPRSLDFTACLWRCATAAAAAALATFNASVCGAAAAALAN